MNKEELECYISSGTATLEGTRKNVDIKLNDILEDERGTLWQVIRVELRNGDIFEPVHVSLFNLKYSDSDESYSTIFMERSYYPNVYDETLKLVYR